MSKRESGSRERSGSRDSNRELPNEAHSTVTKHIANGKVTIHEEQVVDGDRGMLVKYYHKEDGSQEKIIIAGRGGKYIMKTTIGSAETDQKELSYEEVLKTVSKEKKLKFAKDFVESYSQKGGATKKKSGSRSGSRGSKSGSRLKPKKADAKKADTKKAMPKKSK